jgi:hypothetical protein
MDQHAALLMYTLMRDRQLDFSELALRREAIARFEREAREARRRRRRAFVRRTPEWLQRLSPRRQHADAALR